MTLIDIVQAIALVLIIEGSIPFLFPNRWQGLADKLANLSIATIRYSGAITVIVGAIILFIIH